MNDVEVTRIRVGKHPTGIVGLKQALAEVASLFGDKADEIIKDELVNRLSKRNYIAPNIKDLYAKAFLREFNRFIGRPVEEEDRDEIEIKVLGKGCASCQQLTMDLMGLIAECGIDADLEHVTETQEIAKYDVLGFPGLVINGKVVSVGKVLSRSHLKELLMSASNPNFLHKENN